MVAARLEVEEEKGNTSVEAEHVMHHPLRLKLSPPKMKILSRLKFPLPRKLADSTVETLLKKQFG
jgi:hypothetical protein